MIIRILRRFPPALRGLAWAFQSDFSFRTQVVGLNAVNAVVAYTAWPLPLWVLAVLTSATLLVLITELQNSSLEVTLNHLHPTTHDQVCYAKNLAAAAVLLAGFIYAIVVIWILVTYI
jgi:diacylglycerol kinase